MLFSPQTQAHNDSEPHTLTDYSVAILFFLMGGQEPGIVLQLHLVQMRRASCSHKETPVTILCSRTEAQHSRAK